MAKFKTGDKVRYLGDDPMGYDGNLTVGEVYEVVGEFEEYGLPYIYDNYSDGWFIGGEFANDHCFELVTENDDQDVTDLIANLAYRVAELERALERCTDDIATLDERTQPRPITLDVGTLVKLIGGVRK